ncbi:MAG: hypothetical protein IT530_16140 [Burkholderiales bacterium]|nr:hypothetical protein [Burkholderiales bacterium]
MVERSIVGSACGWVRFPAADTPAPIVSDAELDHLGREFLKHGGNARLGPFEAFVRRAHHQSVDPRAYALAMQRRAIDQLTGKP